MGIFQIISLLFIPLLCYTIFKKNGYCKNNKEILSMLAMGVILIVVAIVFHTINYNISGMLELTSFVGVSLVLLVLGLSFVIFSAISFIRVIYLNGSTEK